MFRIFFALLLGCLVSGGSVADEDRLAQELNILATAKLTAIPERIEILVALDDARVAPVLKAMLDGRLYRRTSDDRLFIGVPGDDKSLAVSDPTGELAPPAWAKAELVSERPQHEVSLSSGYWIDRTEVTRASFQAFIDDGGYEKRDLWSEEGWKWNQTPRAVNTPPPGSECVEGPPDEPKVCITWFEAEAYAAWRGGALPTEAQWEYAARGPSSSIFPWGDEWDAAKANVVESVALTPAGSLPAGASWVGALDMAGNAMEWVADWFSISYYKQEVREDPTGPEFGSRKVEKGGWWGADPYVARSAYRHFEDPPTYQDHHIGVRIVSEGEPPA